jgi:hypothetical protein
VLAQSASSLFTAGRRVPSPAPAFILAVADEPGVALGNIRAEGGVRA